MFNNIKMTLKNEGFKGLQKRYGWKVFAGIIAYYLVRDLTIYVVIPYLIIKRI